jgi:tetratricopeptide (TPR) repeat protein
MDEQEYEKILNLIEHYSSSDGYERMRDACLDALRINPYDGWVLKNLALSYYGLRDFDAALKTGETALEYLTSPADKGSVYSIFGHRYSALGDYRKAVEYYRNAVDNCPESAAHLAEYAGALSHIDGRCYEARALLYRAEEISSSDFYVLQSKFLYLFEFHRYRAEEEETLQRMLSVSCYPFIMNWYFAIFHEKYGEYKQAYEYFVKCALIRPWHEPTQKRLKNMEAPFFGVRTRLRAKQSEVCRLFIGIGIFLLGVLSVLLF